MLLKAPLKITLFALHTDHSYSLLLLAEKVDPHQVVFLYENSEANLLAESQSPCRVFVCYSHHTPLQWAK